MLLGKNYTFGNQHQVYMLAESIGANELKQEKRWAEKTLRHGTEPQIKQTLKEEHHEWMV